MCSGPRCPLLRKEGLTGHSLFMEGIRASVEMSGGGGAGEETDC